MPQRTQLLLLNHLSRSRLNLLSEMDVRQRGLERRVAADPSDEHAHRGLSQARMRSTGKPDEEHHWRWNGKGWYTRPGWNGGRCPAGTELTQHNTCLPDDAHQNDKAQYRTSDVSPTQLDDGTPGYLHRTTDPTSGHDSVFHSKDNTRHRRRPDHYGRLDLDHPDGPRFKHTRRGNWYGAPDEVIGRPFPQNPEHLPEIATPARHFHRSAAHKEKIKQHYMQQGYHPDYLSDLIDDRFVSSFDHQGHRRREHRKTNPPPEGSVGYAQPRDDGLSIRERIKRSGLSSKDWRQQQRAARQQHAASRGES